MPAGGGTGRGGVELVGIGVGILCQVAGQAGGDAPTRGQGTKLHLFGLQASTGVVFVGLGGSDGIASGCAGQVGLGDALGQLSFGVIGRA